MTDDDPFGYGSVIRPGHPLYAQVFGRKQVARTISRVTPYSLGDCEALADQIIRGLMTHEPSIFLCTEDEMKDGD